MCDETECPFRQRLRWTFGIFGTYCWIRGKTYNQFVDGLELDYSLYDDLTRSQLKGLLHELRERYGFGTVEERIASLLKGEVPRVYDLILYLETLLSIREWNGKLVAGRMVLDVRWFQRQRTTTRPFSKEWLRACGPSTT